MANVWDAYEDSTPTPTQPKPATSAPSTAPTIHKNVWDAYLEPPKGKPKPQHDPSWWDHINATSHWIASQGAAGAAAVFGAPDNAIVGGELAATKHGNPLKGAWEGLTHPGQANDNVHELEKAWHLPTGGEKGDLVHKGGQFAEDTALQSQSLLIFGLDIVSGIGKALKVGRMIPGVAKVGDAVMNSDAVDRALGYFNPDHEFNKILTPQGVADVKAELYKASQTHGPSNVKSIAHNLANTPNRIKPGYNGQMLEQVLKAHQNIERTEGLLNQAKIDTSMLKWLSEYQRDALFVLPFAHMKNLTVLSGLGPGGIGTIKKGIEYARQLHAQDPVAVAKLKRWTDIGAAAEYRPAGQVSKMYQVPVVGQKLGQLSDWSTEVLSHYDNGLRMAIADHLEKKGMMNENMIGSQIRDIMGDYLHTSGFVADMKAIGGNFPAWRMSVVPKAMWKAAKDNPRGMKLYARASDNFNRDVTGPGENFDVGGPFEDATKLWDAPAGTDSMVTSPSTMGPLSDLFGLKTALGEGQTGKWLKPEMEKYLPFGSIIDKIPGLNPYSDKADPRLQAALGVVGSYMTDNPKLVDRKKQLSRQFGKGHNKDVDEQMKIEGLKKNVWDYYK